MRISSFFLVFFLSINVYSQNKSGFEVYEKVSTDFKKIIFEDNFDSNINGWWIEKQGKYKGQIIGGYYHVSYPDRTKSLLQSVVLNETSDFEIECSIKLDVGSTPFGTSSAVGIVWGRHDYDKNQFSFTYNSIGQTAAKKRSSSTKFKNYVPWERNDHINSGQYNKLTVRKIGTNYYFFVNEKFLASFPFESFFGNRLGFAVSNGNIVVDYFRISKIDLSRNFNHTNSPHININAEELIFLDSSEKEAITQYNDLGVKINKSMPSIKSDVDVDIPMNKEINSNRFALVIGNEDYSSKQKSLSNEVDVAFARSDAEIFKNYLVSFLGFQDDQVTLLKDATSGELIREIERLVLLGKLDSRSELVFYYAGHGLPDDETKAPYLIPVDVSTINVKQSGVSLNELYTKLASTNASKITVFIDACFSGGGRNEGLLAARGVKIKPKEEASLGNMVIFASSTGEERSLPYEDKQHGFFTYFLLKKLQETEGSVNYGDLEEYIRIEVSKKSLIKKSLQQTPNVNISPIVADNWRSWSFR